MGLILSIIASILYGINPSFVSIVLDSGVATTDVSIICSSLICLIAFIVCKICKVDLKMSNQYIVPIIACGVCFVFTNLLLSLAYTHIPVGFATMFHFTYPSIVFLFCVFVYKEIATIIKIAATILTLIGLYMISGSSNAVDVTGVIAALASAFCYGFYMIISEKSFIVHCPSQKFTFYVALIGAITASAIRLLSPVGLSSSFALAFKPLNFFLLLLSALMLFGANFCLNKGIKLLGANKAASFTVVEPLTSMLFSTMLFHYDISTTCIIGCGLILLSLYLASK